MIFTRESRQNPSLSIRFSKYITPSLALQSREPLPNLCFVEAPVCSLARSVRSRDKPTKAKPSNFMCAPARKIHGPLDVTDRRSVEYRGIAHTRRGYQTEYGSGHSEKNSPRIVTAILGLASGPVRQHAGDLYISKNYAASSCLRKFSLHRSQIRVTAGCSMDSSIPTRAFAAHSSTDR